MSFSEAAKNLLAIATQLLKGLVVLILIAISFYIYLHLPGWRTRSRSLQDYVGSAISGNKFVEFSSYANASFNKVCLLTPYMPETEVASCLGFPWKGYRATGIESQDSHNIIVLVDGDSVAEWAAISRQHGDLKPAGADMQTPGCCLPRSSAKYVLAEYNN